MKIIFLIIFSIYIYAEHPMFFYSKPIEKESIIVQNYVYKGQRVIYANGVIENGTVAKFKKYVEHQGIQKGLVVFKSSGGSLLEGIELGKAIRDLGFNTTIGYLDHRHNNRFEGICASACAYAFAGGVARFIYNNNQKLGVHQFYSLNNGNMDDIGVVQSLNAIVADHLLEMGINPKAFVLASSVSSKQMKWLSKSEALTLNFANNGKNPSIAEIKIMKEKGKRQQPYILIQQTRVEGIGKLIFYCDNQNIKLLAGITTTKSNALHYYDTLQKSYFELDNENILITYQKKNANRTNDTLWLERTINKYTMNKILNSNIMNIWTENGDYIRWGIQIDLYPVREKLKEYIDSCHVTSYVPRNNNDALSYF